MKKILKVLDPSGGTKTKVSGKNQKLLLQINLEDHQMLDPSQIELKQMIGQGGFAKVYKCDYAGQTAVAKVIDSSRLNEEMTYLLTNESTIWAKLAHPNIVSFFGMCTDTNPPAVMLVCELLPDGALQDRLEKLRKSGAAPPKELEIVGQLQQIAKGMDYLHGMEPHPVLHRDLKSANLLLTDGGKRLAIADFGLARYQANAGKKMTAETGSYRWMAPEVIRHEEYDKRCDVYSFAILAWEMLTYRIPFDNLMPVEAAFAVAREAKRPPIPEAYHTRPIAEMLNACWHQASEKRPEFPTITKALEEEIEILQQEQ
jgi:serine/threonine protein kinase